MNNILGRMGGSQGQFRPRTQEEFFPLQLARRLGDPGRVHSYIDLAKRYSRTVLLRAYRRAVKSGNRDRLQRFHREVERLGQEVVE